LLGWSAVLVVAVAGMFGWSPVEAVFRGTTVSPAASFGADASFYDGPLYGWGANTKYNVGVGNTTAKTSPVQVSATTSWIMVDTGSGEPVDTVSGHSCGVRTDGQLWCAGQQAYGQHGRGGTDTSTYPTMTRVGTASDWAYVDTGPWSSCAIKTTGRMYCAGSNDTGRLGTGTADTGSYPAFSEVSGSATTWKQVATGNGFNCATRTTGALYCWGEGSDYRLGNGSTTDRYSPYALTDTDWDTLAIGRRHGCAIKTDGRLFCWGLNASGQLGDGTLTTQGTPTAVVPASGTNAFLMVTGGSDHTCAIKTNRTLWCWGDNATYQLGLGATTTDRDQPTQVGSAQWLSVSAGHDYTCGTQLNKTVWCWGDNTEGSLGQGNYTSLTVPTQVSGMSGRRVYAGGYGGHTTFVIAS